MSQMIPKSRFKPRALNYFRQVEQTGKEIIFTDHGKPVLKLMPYTEKPEAWLKPLRGTVKKFRRPTEPVASGEWEALR